MSKKLGFIGLGIMGLSMARNLLKTGSEVTVWNRSPGREAELRADGLTVAQSAKAVGESSEILFVCVTNGAAVESVLFGEGGALTGKSCPRIVVDCSTIAPSEARDLAERAAKKGVVFLDAPVTGGDLGAKNGTLAIMVGGERSAFDEFCTISPAIAKSVQYMGASGAGQLTKCVNQIAVAVSIAAMTEALVFAEQVGLDKALVLEVIGGGAAGSWAINNYAPRILKGDLAPGFHARNMLKDLRIAMSECERYGIALPVTGLIKELYTALIASEGEASEKLGNHALIHLYRKLGSVLTN